MPARAALALTLTLCAGASACDSGDDPPAATVTPTAAPPETTAPAPTPTSTPPPADPDLGARLRYEGEYEAAIDVYSAIVAQDDDPAAKQRARLSAAQLLVQEERFDEARATLEAYVTEAPGSDGSTASFMLALTLDELGDVPGALAQYERYVASGGVLAEYAQVERAKLLARSGRGAEAEPIAEAVLAGGLAQAVKNSFIFSFAAAYERGGDAQAALRWYQRAGSFSGDVATANARTGALRKAAGDPAWVNDYLAVVTGYPESGPAASVLDELIAAGVAVAPYDRGYINYRAFRNAAARAALEEAVVAGDRVALATYYLAAIDERFGENASAIERYQRVFELDPSTPRSDDALWWRGRLLQAAGRYDEAQATYELLLQARPDSEWAGDARFHQGMAQFRGGDPAAAVLTWTALSGETRGDERSRALFWQARAEQAAGAPTGVPASTAHFEALIAEDPGSFYALRAESVLGKNERDADEPDMEYDAPDWDRAARELTRALGFNPDAPTVGPDDARWAIGAELEAVGLTAQADAIYAALINDSGGAISALFPVARRLEQEGRTDHAARAATRLINALPAGVEPPDDVLKAAYPLAYADLVAAAAKTRDLDPLLLLALVRQESFFDPHAGSTAGALGLTQVIEPTGRAIAQSLGVTDFELSDLFRPALSLRFGASYIADQLRAFDGNQYHALAAYNGGPGTASDAIDSSGGDLDLFVEDLEFDETRLYVRLVMEYYARYRQLYAGVGRPSLPQ